MSTMAIKRPSIPAAADEGHKGRVCVICYGEDAYAIFILDFDGACPDAFVEKQPTLRIKTVEQMCFCLLDSCLYMFYNSGYSKTESMFHESVFKTFKFDLSPHIWKSNLVVELDMLEAGPDMKSPKWNPGAIQTPDERIMVFSRVINYYNFEGEEMKEIEIGKSDFEVFDPESGSWTSLPQLLLLVPPHGKPNLFYLRDQYGEWIEHYGTKDHGPYYDKGSRKVAPNTLSIGGCTFINRNTFVVGVPIGAMFTLNIDSPEEGWKRHNDKIRPEWYDFLVVEGVTLTPFTVRRGTEYHDFRLSWFPGYSVDTPFRQISILDYIPKLECTVCIVGNGIDRETGYPYLICDLFRVDVFMEAPHVRVGSFKYVVREESYSFCLTDVFPMVVFF